MSKLLKGIIIVTLFVVASSVNAQNFKFGHINSQELLMSMPERDSAESKLKKYAQDLQDQIETLGVEYNRKAQDYVQKKATFTDAIREIKEKELNDLQQRAQEFEQTAQQDYQRMQGELMKPIMDKANEAIKKVAKANAFTYIFDVATGGVVYFSEQSTDILPLVKKELGIKEAAAPTKK